MACMHSHAIKEMPQNTGSAERPGHAGAVRSYILPGGPSIRPDSALRYRIATMGWPPMPETFESALQARTDAMADACTRCGKCVEVCPATAAAGLSLEQRQHPVEVI